MRGFREAAIGVASAAAFSGALAPNANADDVNRQQHVTECQVAWGAMFTNPSDAEGQKVTPSADGRTLAVDLERVNMRDENQSYYAKYCGDVTLKTTIETIVTQGDKLIADEVIVDPSNDDGGPVKKTIQTTTPLKTGSFLYSFKAHVEAPEDTATNGAYENVNSYNGTFTEQTTPSNPNPGSPDTGGDQGSNNGTGGAEAPTNTPPANNVLNTETIQILPNETLAQKADRLRKCLAHYANFYTQDMDKKVKGIQGFSFSIPDARKRHAIFKADPVNMRSSKEFKSADACNDLGIKEKVVVDIKQGKHTIGEKIVIKGQSTGKKINTTIKTGKINTNKSVYAQVTTTPYAPAVDGSGLNVYPKHPGVQKTGKLKFV